MSWTNRDKSLEPAVPKGKKGKSRSAQGINVAFRFIVDKLGNPVDGYRITDIRSVSRGIWAHLSNNQIAPESWGKASLSITDLYRTQMESRFEELRLCAGGWKALHFASESYTSWRIPRVMNGTFNVKPKTKLKDEDNDDDDDDNDSLDENEKENIPAKRKNKARDPVVKKSKVNADDTVNAEDTVVPPRPRPTPVQVCVVVLLCHFPYTTYFLDQ
jgi:hypothetical protein